MNYEKDTEIDPSQLDVEWLEQSRLTLQYTKHQAQTQKDEDAEKEKLIFTDAKLDKEIRNDPEKFGITKITDTVIKNTILLQDNHKNVFKECTEARFENNTAKGAVKAMDVKKTSLENLVKLNGQQYFAGPRSPRDISQEWEKHEQQKKVDSGIGKRLNRKRTK